jgi:hypothetical protein
MEISWQANVLIISDTKTNVRGSPFSKYSNIKPVFKEEVSSSGGTMDEEMEYLADLIVEQHRLAESFTEKAKEAQRKESMLVRIAKLVLVGYQDMETQKEISRQHQMVMDHQFFKGGEQSRGTGSSH